MFFGVPHGGARLPKDWAPVLTLLGLFGFLQVDKIRDLQAKSDILNIIADRFGRVRNQYSIPVQSCWEGKKTKTTLVTKRFVSW
jgi:hypothetical protein